MPNRHSATRHPRQPPGRLIVGLTGGIGSGKSTVARLFLERGAGIVDTDAIAHELTQPGGAALRPIAERFGADYVDASGKLDRAKLRTRVFADAGERTALESILHPLIALEVRTRIRSSEAPYVIVVVPLLVETGAYRDLLARVLLVDCDEQVQIERTMRRSGLSADEVRRIMAAQATRSERLALADDIIVNNTGLDELAPQVAALDARYRALVRSS